MRFTNEPVQINFEPNDKHFGMFIEFTNLQSQI